MGRVAINQRRGQINRRRVRRQKLAKLRVKLAKASGTTEKKSIWEKVRKLAPWLTQAEFSQKV